MSKIVGMLVVLSLSFAVFAGEHKHEMPAAKTNKEFEQLKTLVGKWEGKTKMGDKEQTVTATYELTSGGSIILEKIFAGTPHEMVTIYRPEGKGVALTHYCALGNEPKMKLIKSDDKSIAFEMKGKEGLASPKEHHMHALAIKWDSPTKITTEWTSFNKGKKEDTSTFTLVKQ